MKTGIYTFLLVVSNMFCIFAVRNLVVNELLLSHTLFKDKADGAGWTGNFLPNGNWISQPSAPFFHFSKSSTMRNPEVSEQVFIPAPGMAIPSTQPLSEHELLIKQIKREIFIKEKRAAILHEVNNNPEAYPYVDSHPLYHKYFNE